jgi:hypothetical protein
MVYFCLGESITLCLQIAHEIGSSVCIVILEEDFHCGQINGLHVVNFLHCGQQLLSLFLHV